MAARICPLAIMTPEVGLLSQTFVRRHVENLLPHDTAVVAGRRSVEHAWDVTGPLLELQSFRPGLPQRAVDAVARRMSRRHVTPTVPAVKRFLTQHRVEVIMGEFVDFSLPWIDTARELGVRFFAHEHGSDVLWHARDEQWKSDFLKYNDVGGVITTSRFGRARLIDFGLRSDRVHVIPCGVDVPSAPVIRDARAIVRCLVVGRMVAKKGPILVLDAFRRALEVIPNLHLDFVGADVLFPAAQQFVHALGLEAHVTLHGAQSNETVQQMMHDADIFLLHSVTARGKEEGLPVAILEAMSHALPVLSTRHTGIPEAVEDGVTGYLVEEGDTVDMADRIVRLSKDHERRAAMGIAGWTRARERFSWQHEAAQLRTVLGLPASSV
jgi:glycosyltransferase involved in cell wall biosynthesis